MSENFVVDYLKAATDLMTRISIEEAAVTQLAAEHLASHIAQDRLVYVYGPGGHSNLAAQEIFFRAGGLMHVSAILEEGTLLSNGALRSKAVERLPNYGKDVICDHDLIPGDILVLVNSSGINAVLIDAALEAKARQVFLIGVSSRRHAEESAKDHPSRHPSGANLHEIVDLHIDTKLEMGDASVVVDGVGEKVGALSTFANAFALNALVICTVAELAKRGIEAPIWRSSDTPDGDAVNAQFLERFRHRVRAL